MMKHIIFTGALLLASAMAGEAMAQCSAGGGWTQVTGLVSTLTNGNAANGRTACSLVGKGTQEEHHSDGTLWDYKCGNTDAANIHCPKPDTDRRKQLGTWSVSGDNSSAAAVTYTYNAFGGPVTEGPYQVFFDGASVYDFCSGPTSVGTFTLVNTTGTSRVCPL